MRASFADQQVPPKGSLAVPYPDQKAIARGLGAHLTDCFMGEATGRGDAAAGLVTERTANIPAPGFLDYASSSAADLTQHLTVYGLNAGGAVISETVTLNGATTVHGALSFTKVLAAVLSAAAAGTVTVKDTVIPTTLFSIAPATLTRGYKPEAFTADGALTVSIDTNAAVKVVVLGLNAAGAAVSDVFDMTAGATTPVVGTTLFASVTAVLLGDVAAARTVTVSGGDTALRGIPFEPAIVDVYDLTTQIMQRRIPGSAGPVDINTDTGALATTPMAVAVDDATVPSWKVTMPRALAPAGHTMHVVARGFRDAGGSL